MKTNIRPSEEETKAAVAHILSESLLLIRLKGALGDHKSCEIEADHVHNLPNLLMNFTDDLLAFYYNIERKEYLVQTKGRHPQSYDANWKILAERLGL